MTVLFLRDSRLMHHPKNRILPTENFERSWVMDSIYLLWEGQHRQAAVDVFCQTGEHPWTVGHIFMHLIIHEMELILNRLGPLSPAKHATLPLLWCTTIQRSLTELSTGQLCWGVRLRVQIEIGRHLHKRFRRQHTVIRLSTNQGTSDLCRISMAQ